MAAAKPAAKGDVLTCEVCGLAVVVDEVCGCVDAHEIICCDVPMTKRSRSAKRTAAKPKARAARPKPRAKAKK